jgi:hypothetical protein
MGGILGEARSIRPYTRHPKHLPDTKFPEEVTVSYDVLNLAVCSY